MLVYVSYYTTSYTTTCGTFIDRFTVRKKNGVGLVCCLFLFFFFFVLIIKLACFLFLFCVFIQTVVQPTRLSPGSRMSVHPLPVLWENPSQHVSPSHGSRTPNCYSTTLTRGHAPCAAHLHFIPPHSSSSSSSSSPSDRDVQGRIWR